MDRSLIRKTYSIVIGTSNVKKRHEIEVILSDLPLQFLSIDDFNSMSEIEEDGLTFEKNAVKKAVTLSKWCKTLVIADDSGLEVRALGGKPGVFSSRYAGKDATDAMRIKKLLDEMKTIPEEDRVARFRCAIALADPQGLIFVVEAGCNGIITKEPAGENGFGYDPVFYVPEYGKTFGQLAPEIKNKISHRAKALAIFREKLKDYLISQSSCRTSGARKQ